MGLKGYRLWVNLIPTCRVPPQVQLAAAALELQPVALGVHAVRGVRGAGTLLSAKIVSLARLILL
jgi:hypothetical protein